MTEQHKRNPASIDVTEDTGPKVPLKERWANYQPNKKSLYKTAGYSVFWTLVLGFTVGGWHTSGGAQELAQQARVDYAAQQCVDKFMAADVTGRNLASLKKVRGDTQRSNVLEDGKWVVAVSGSSEAFIHEVAVACAERLTTGGAGADGKRDGRTA